MSVLATDITPDWLRVRATCLRMNGHAFRPHAERPSIEVKSLHNDQWYLLTLPGERHDFATTQDRDQTYRALRALQ